MKRNDKILHY
ncbi:hypothetical protein WCH81_001387 [Escherichia coli]|nr:hypothetical protein [Escherichia coli]EIG6215188.1 hypothetical protein [Shigella dysenteriae]EIH4987767.1 hypothetical protein [Shigella boydii]QWV67258.1 hypothetical protein KQ219_09625 [Escherichia coli O85:H1]HDL6810157.1 hypothetical protein [Escherichia coli 371_08]HDL6814946.1 hypothetical protein [Escherichia coli 290_10]HDL6829387.1 hypothetical protein [Escherichia coli 229_11]HDL7557320.1 hypothetical protein [Escherichia coli 151_06]